MYVYVSQIPSCCVVCVCVCIIISIITHTFFFFSLPLFACFRAGMHDRGYVVVDGSSAQALILPYIAIEPIHLSPPPLSAGTTHHPPSPTASHSTFTLPALTTTTTTLARSSRFARVALTFFS